MFATLIPSRYELAHRASSWVCGDGQNSIAVGERSEVLPMSSICMDEKVKNTSVVVIDVKHMSNMNEHLIV